MPEAPAINMRRQKVSWDGQEETPSERPRSLLVRRRGRSWGRMVVRALAVVATLSVVAAVGIGVLLVSGPTDVGFVRDQVVQVLRNGLGDDYRVTTGRAVIDFDRLIGGLVIRVDDIEVADRAENVVARVPATRFRVNTAALLTLRLEVKAIEIDRPEINFIRLTDGTVRLGSLETPLLGKPAEAVATTVVVGPDGGFPDLVGPLRILDRGIEPPIYAAIRAGFNHLAMTEADIVVWDQAGARQRRFTNSNLEIDLEPKSGRLLAAFDTLGHNGRWSASLDRTLGDEGAGHEMTAVFSELTLADLLPGLGGQGPVEADVPLYGRASFGFDSAGNISFADAWLDMGAGVVSYAGGHETLHLDEASVRLRWDVANRALIVDPSSFFFGETRGAISGRVQARGEGDNLRYDYSFTSQGAVLGARDAGLPPLVARQIEVSGSADPSDRLLTIDTATIVTDEGSFAAVGSLGFEGETPSLALAASISPMSAQTLVRMWSPLIAPGARRWVANNVVGGNIVEGTLEAAIPAGILWTNERQEFAADQLQLNMRFEDAEFRTFGEVPNIEAADGNVVLAGNTFGVDFTTGFIRTNHGDVEVLAGAFAVPDTSARPSNGVIELQASGPAKALGVVADSKPMRALAVQSVTPEDLDGSARVSVSVRLPLRDTITDEDVDWHVVVDTDAVSSAVPLEGRRVSDAEVIIDVTPGEVTVYGQATIDGVAADVSMAFPTNGSRQAGPGARLVRVILDDEARKKLGIGLENMLSGSITALVSDAENGGQHYELDLERARLTLPGMGWTKGVGVPASMSFDIRMVEDGHDISNLILRGDGFSFHGVAKLDPSYGLVEADIAHLALRKGDSLSIRIIRGTSGYAINARGEAFNLQGLITQVRDSYEQSGGFPDLALNADVERLLGFNQEVIEDVSLRLVSVAGDTQKLSLRGNLGGEISLDYEVRPDRQTLSGVAADAGRLMRFTDFYNRVQGGVVRLSGEGPAEADMTGLFEVTNFFVLDEPAMERVVVTSSDGSAAFNPGRVAFQRMVARFRRSERLLTIEEALLRGTAVGATFQGRYDIPTTHLTITGTYLPAYALNNLFGQIPILGLALGGGGREGLIGVTFKVDGPIAGPDIFFNPISAVAPGIFRRIFEFQ